MSAAQRQQKFEEAITALPGVIPEARIAKNFGFSNSAKVIEGGLFACTNNLETYSANLAAGTAKPLSQLVFLCVLTFPPQDEVYFAVVVESEAARVNQGLLKLHQEGERRNATLVAAGRKPGSISNNVKFYITDDSRIYFHNYDFLESLHPAPGEPQLDPDCLANVDRIYFGIWPPAVSARRSLLAREFVGYLGNLIGRAKVHELRVWDDPHAVGALMQRMPSSLAVGDIEQAVDAMGGHYPHGEVRRLHAALNFHPNKHFVILSGVSGTGKTQLAIKYARAVHGVSAGTDDPFLVICPVRPEWTDPSGLTGYYDVLSNRYVVPPFLEAVLLATKHRDSPVFVVLDELNLARVEYYFSDVLSCVETGEPLRLHTSGVPLEGTTGESIPAELPLPRNLFIVGTINVDETTNPVSDKVLDRAMVIDTAIIDLAGFLQRLEGDAAIAASAQACAAPLIAAHTAMTAHDMGFGYRVAEEAVRYHAFVGANVPGDKAQVIDDLMVQKILVKLRGTERHRALLSGLQAGLAGLPRATALLNRLVADLDEFGAFQAGR
jgi:hypothetical protein